MGEEITVIAAALSIGVKLTAGFFMLLFAEKRHRKVALFWGIAWIFSAYALVGDITSNYYLGALFDALFASVFVYGTIRLLESKPVTWKLAVAISSLPLAITGYVLAGFKLYGGGDFTVMGIGHGVSGLFLMFSAVLILQTTDSRGRKALYLAIVLAVYGFHQADYMFLRPVGWFAPIGFILGLALTVLATLLTVEFVTAFPGLPKEVPHQDIKPGILLTKPEKLGEIIESLKDYPVLAFIRSFNPPKAWQYFRITNVAGDNALPPTNLARILETAVRYLMAFKKEQEEATPVILVEGLEYLRLYNDFQGLARFLSTLRDYVKVNNGALILVIDENSWDKRELEILKRVLLD